MRKYCFSSIGLLSEKSHQLEKKPSTLKKKASHLRGMMGWFNQRPFGGFASTRFKRWWHFLYRVYETGLPEVGDGLGYHYFYISIQHVVYLFILLPHFFNKYMICVCFVYFVYSINMCFWPLHYIQIMCLLRVWNQSTAFAKKKQ